MLSSEMPDPGFEFAVDRDADSFATYLGKPLSASRRPLIRHIVRANSGRVDFRLGQADDRRSQLEARHARASD